MKGCVHIDSKS